MNRLADFNIVSGDKQPEATIGLILKSMAQFMTDRVSLVRARRPDREAAVMVILLGEDAYKEVMPALVAALPSLKSIGKGSHIRIDETSHCSLIFKAIEAEGGEVAGCKFMVSDIPIQITAIVGPKVTAKVGEALTLVGVPTVI